MKRKVFASVAGATILLTLLSVLGKGIGFIREIIYAHNFGLTPEYDLYLTSAALPLVLNTSFIFICQHYFVPAYYNIKNGSQKSAYDFFNVVFWRFLISGILLAIVAFAFSEPIINVYMNSLPNEIQEKGIVIFKLFIITIPFNAGISIASAFLQAEFKFMLPSIANMLINVIVILLVLLFTNTFQIMILPLSFIVAYVFAFIFLLPPVWSKIKKFNFNILKSKPGTNHKDIIVVLIIIEVLSLSYSLIDRYFLGAIPQGGIAALSYAITIYALPVSIFTLSLVTPVFTRFSESSLDSNGKLLGDLKSALGINAFVIVPVSFIFFFWGDSLITIFYQRGKFLNSDSLLTHQALQYYIVSLVFYSSYLIVVKLFYSLNDYKSILFISVIAFILKIIFNVFSVDSMHQNGLALSTSLIYLFLFLSSFNIGLRKIQCTEKFIHINFIVYFIVNGMTSYVISSTLFGFYIKHSTSGFIMECSVFILIYILNSFILKDTEPRLISKTIYRFAK